MCLDAHAHGMRVDHEIFHTPHQVALTIEEQPTPQAYGRFDLGDTMPMWRVQTEGYTDGDDQLIGVVSSDAGFLDSPDVEWISGGVNTKRPDAVALGRHGNLFHWGFAASPTYMTEEAKLVFVNAIHYIAKFDGRRPIARRVPGIMSRAGVREALDRISEAGHAVELAQHEYFLQRIRERNAEIRARIAAGESVADVERRALDSPLPKAPERFAPVKRFVPEEDWEALAGDETAIRARIEADLPYLRGEGWYQLVVDEELRAFGVANHDPALLDRAVGALRAGDGERAQLARTLLQRYTDERFATAAEWAAWLDENRDRLFFTEIGGFKWLVDARAPRARAALPEVGSAVLLEPSLDEPVVGALAVTSQQDGNHALVLAVSILEGWHAYRDVPEGQPYVPMTVTLDLPGGMTAVGDWQLPAGAPYPADPEITVYEGQLEFRHEISGELLSGAEVACELRYQVCDENMCLPPSRLRVVAAAAGQ